MEEEEDNDQGCSEDHGGGGCWPEKVKGQVGSGQVTSGAGPPF